MTDDPYQILGVSRDASDDEIKRAYRALAKKYHPDRNPGDQAAAKKMQQINAAYERIKNPEKANPSGGYGSTGGYGGYGYDPFGGAWQRAYQQQQREQSSADQYQRAAQQYIRFRRFQEALNTLASCTNRDAHWYYLSALANQGLGNQVTALEHIKKAVSMAPDNDLYLQALEEMENGGAAYRTQAGGYRTYSAAGGSGLAGLCLCWLVQLCCCRGRIFCC